MTFITDRSNADRLDNKHPNPSDQTGLREDGINYLSYRLDLTTAQATEIFDIVEARGRGVARFQIWNAALVAARAGGYAEKLQFNILAREFVNLFKGGFWTDPFPGKSNALGTVI